LPFATSPAKPFCQQLKRSRTDVQSVRCFDGNEKQELGMKALAWHGKGEIRCEEVPDPKIEHPRDAIIKVTACAICGSDLHIYGGIIPSMKKGDVLSHENMGEVVEVGSENTKLKIGDRVVVPFTISCGECFFCRNGFIRAVSGQIGPRRRC
jgi:threonine dehydrogenase-like Zn-dependent dehydrogenase